MRYFFPYRRTAGGTLRIEIQDGKPGDYETLSDKYFLSIQKVNEEIESDLGTLRLADVNLDIVDIDRKFRDGIFTGDDQKFLKLLYEERQPTYLTPKGLDLDGSTEYLFSNSADFDMNGSEEMTNTDFEAGTSGWTLSAKSSRSNAYAHSGTWSLSNLGGGSPDYDEYVFDSNRMHQVTAEAWVRIHSYTSGAVRLELLDSTNNVLASRNANTGTVGSWQKLVLNIDSLLVRKIRLRNTGTAVVYWDDVSVTRAWDFTVAGWLKFNNNSALQIPFSKGLAAAGAAGVEWMINHPSDPGDMQFTLCDGYGSAIYVVPSNSPLDGSFHFFALSVKRNGNALAFTDEVSASSSVSGLGKFTTSDDLVLGGRKTGYLLQGTLGEVMIIKGWAADAATVADWYANGIRMRSDTIGFWRWQHPTDVGKDYSGKGHALTLHNVDTNDIVDGSWGSFGMYQQRAQASESLFFGVAKLAPQGHDEKKDIVKLIGYSPLKDLENASLDDLWSAIQAGGYPETRSAFHPQVSGDPVYEPPTVQAVSLANILRAMGSLIGCSTLLAETAWRFGIEAGAPYAVDFGFDDLYLITDENGSGVFDTVFSRSALSWRNLYANCGELLKAIQLALFAFARGQYDADSGMTILYLRQRGLPNESPVVPAGKLLEYTREYVENGGVLVKNQYGLPFSLPPNPFPTVAEMQTQFGTGAVEVALPFKTYERRLFDYGYAYLYASWRPSMNAEMITNGDFETNTQGWTLNGASSRDNTRAHSGSWSLKDAGASGNYNEWIMPADLPGDLIEVTGYLWSSAGSTTAVRIELLGANDVVLRTYRTRVNAQWQDLQDLLAQRVLKIRLYGNTTANPVWWDGLSARAVVPGHLTDGIYICNSVTPLGWPLNGALQPNLHHALANAYGLSSVGLKEAHVRTFHRPVVTKDGVISMEHARVLEREEFPYRGEVMNLETIRTELDVEKNVMTRWGIKRCQ